MSILHLALPTEEDLPEVGEFKQEFFAAGERVINGGALLDQLDLLDWLALVRRNRKPESVPCDWVVSSTFLARRQSDNRIVGIIDVRHSIDTEFLTEYGGHIGYAVRPGERGQGYATEMLRLAVEFAKSIGLSEIMIGCYSNNLASKRVIEACGGFLIETKPYLTGQPMDKYRIACSDY